MDRQTLTLMAIQRSQCSNCRIMERQHPVIKSKLRGSYESSLYKAHYSHNANGDSTCLVELTLLVFFQRKDSEKDACPASPLTFEHKGQEYSSYFVVDVGDSLRKSACCYNGCSFLFSRRVKRSV